jgi:hypothetical protein
MVLRKLGERKLKILITGFQRSGTTLMRRLVQAHPEVRRVFHEQFLLKRNKSKRALYSYLRSQGVKPNDDIWGEKVPYYPGVRKTSVIQYCKMWEEYFGKHAKIIHIVRHPIDVALSVMHMYGVPFRGPKRVYKRIIPKVIPIFLENPKVYNVKYEDLLLNYDKVLPNIFKFCGLNPKANIEKELQKSKKIRYRKIDPSRAFAYKNRGGYNTKGLNRVIEVANMIEGPKYEL